MGKKIKGLGDCLAVEGKGKRGRFGVRVPSAGWIKCLSWNKGTQEDEKQVLGVECDEPGFGYGRLEAPVKHLGTEESELETWGLLGLSGGGNQGRG